MEDVTICRVSPPPLLLLPLEQALRQQVDAASRLINRLGITILITMMSRSKYYTRHPPVTMD